MFCPKCGKENLEGAQLCSSCSWGLSSVATAPLPDAKTSGLAITSLVLGILSFCTFFITAVPAIVFGIIALVKISKSRGQLKGNGLAISGIALPAVSALLVIPMMLAILMPALGKVRNLSYRLMCGTNMGSLSKAMAVYANDYHEQYPTPSKWCDLLVEKADVTPMQLKCKGAPNDGRCNYAMNKNVEKLGMAAPADMVLVFEAGPGWNQYGGAELLSTENHHGEGCNVLFVDGHVEFVMAKEIGNLRWTADKNK
jgi:prepilin-type processing-associated H-X9-DG protein